jgi:hypothetical protein
MQKGMAGNQAGNWESAVLCIFGKITCRIENDEQGVILQVAVS